MLHAQQHKIISFYKKFVYDCFYSTLKNNN